MKTLPTAAEALFVPPSPDGSRKKCGNCIMFVQPGDGEAKGRCVIHERSRPIGEGDVCGYHVFGEPMTEWMEHAGIMPVTPQISGLIDTPGHQGTSCDLCIHYRGGARPVCEAVTTNDGGSLLPVSPLACCSRWTDGRDPMRPFVGAAKGPLGNQGVRERKPTEKHLERLIQGYVDAYLEAARAAALAAVEVLRQGGTLNVRLPEAREAYLKALLPILDQLDAIVADAVRLGAARRWDPRERGDDIERLVSLIVPQVRQRREYWLRKMATDFVRTVLSPALEADPGDGEPRVAGSRLPGFDAAVPDPSFTIVGPRPGFVELGDPDKEYEFSEEMLDELLAKGYRFAKVRAVEATEHDVFNGDDIAYIEASREDGVQSFVWMTSEDPLVCPICDDLDGQVFTPAEAEQASADRATYSHCRCRCWFRADDGI